MKIEEMHPVTLCILPTPLMEMPVLSAKLGGPQILIKRDDLTGLAIGGQKSRLLEFELSVAKDMGADTVIAGSGPQENIAPQIAAAARKLGMDIITLIYKDDYRIQGNFLLLNLLAEIKVTDIEHGERAKVSNQMVSKQMEELAAELRSKGRRPYIIPLFGSKVSLVGYARAVSEICKQLQERGMTAQHLFLATYTGYTQAGLSLGVKYFEAPFKIVGTTATDRFLTREEQVHNITHLVNTAAKFFEMNFTFTSDEVILHDEYIGEGYSIPPKKSIEAVKLVAQTEGIFLDPIYTGRAMAALIDQVCEGKIKREDTVIFYHSGGLPTIFTYSEELSA